MELMNSKKGFVFSILAVFIVATAVIFALSVSSTGELSELEVKTQRVNTVDEFVQAALDDSQAAFDIAAFNALFGLQEKQSSELEYVNDARAALIALMLTGEYEGDDSYAQISTTNLADWKETITELGSYQGVDVNFTDESVLEVYHESHWFVTFSWTANMIFKDSLSDSVWEEKIDAITSIPVERFYEPLHNVDGRAKIKVIEATDTDALDIVADRTFVANVDAPSFLQRLEGPPYGEPDGYGFETLVDVTDYSNVQGIESESNSAQDWLFFSDENVDINDACLLEGQSGDIYIAGSQCGAYDLVLVDQTLSGN
jgi:hypothetical protein